jgi:signal transduction histidine kinase
VSAPAQVRLTLEQAGSRSGPDFTPVYEGKEVTVRGQVSAKPLWAVESYYLPIQDEAEYGLLLKSSANQWNGTVPPEFAGYEPGDWVEVTGTIARKTGMAVLQPREMHEFAHGAPPLPKDLNLQQLNSFRYVGVLIRTQSKLATAGGNAGGALLTLSDHNRQLNMFLPKVRRNAETGIEGYRSGDLVRVTGIATQYCTLPPYDRSYQVLLGNSAGIHLVEKAWLIPPVMLLSALFAIIALLILWSIRERHTARQRRTVRILNTAGEEVISAGSAGDIVHKLMLVLSKQMRISGVGTFVCNRQSQTIDSFYGEGSASDYGDMQPPAAPILEAASVAFRNRTLLSISDTRRSPLFATSKTPPPRSVLFVPMLVQSEIIGVLEVECVNTTRYFTDHEQTALQHLANQAAAALKLQEQQMVREQIFRTEKLASAGQLMSGIANELRTPIESILTAAQIVRAREGTTDPLLGSIASEARRAADIVQRLRAFSQTEQVEAEPVDLNEMLVEVSEMHSEARHARPLTIRRRLANQTLIAFGSREQLAQVVLNLLIYAEQSMTESRSAAEINLGSALMARRAIIEISWPARTSEADADRGAVELIEKTGLSLEVCHGIIQSHGGELRVSQSGSEVRFELDLPVMETKQRVEPSTNKQQRITRRQLTVLVVEPEAGSQRHVVGTFSGLGHRVVPVASAEEGADLAERMRFDLVVCSVRLPGLNWAGFLERVRSQVGGVVLLTDTYDPNLVRTFQSSDVYVLNKPADPADLKQICETIELSEVRSALVR